MIITQLLIICMQVGNESNPVTADDYFSLSYVSSCSTSPSGHYTAWTEGRWDKDLDRRNYDIWISPTHGERNPARITFDEANDGSLQWVESDEWLYFSSRRGSKGETLPRNGKKQIWRIKPNGTQLMAVTRLESGVIDWTLSDDGKSVYYTLDDETQVDDDWKQLRKDHDDPSPGPPSRPRNRVRPVSMWGGARSPLRSGIFQFRPGSCR